MVGSALSRGPDDTGATVGVPNVAEMVEGLRTRLDMGPGELSGPDGYQRGLKELIDRRGMDAANFFIAESVREALRDPAPPFGSERLEQMPEAWHLPRGLAALGRLLAHLEDRTPTVFTTNFDPLIEVAVRAAGGRAVRRIVDQGGRLDDMEVESDTTQVVHLHGHWHSSDTLHTQSQLTADRPDLEDSLYRMLDGAVVVALGYGAWDDVFTRTLQKAARSLRPAPDVIWTVYGAASRFVADRQDLLQRLAPAGARVSYFEQIDAHAFLPKLANEVAWDARLRTDSRMLGQGRLRRDVMDTLARGLPQPVEIIAPPKMGASTFLADLDARLRLAGHRVARVDAQRFFASAPAFVEAVAEQLGCETKIQEVLHEETAVPTCDDASRAMRALGPVTLLIDQAQAMAVDGHGFDTGFFSTLRALTGGGTLRWVSASPEPLHHRFRNVGLSSQFLNDAVAFPLGALDADGFEAWCRDRELDASRSTWLAQASGRVVVIAEQLARVVERPTQPDKAVEEVARWCQPLFQRWIALGRSIDGAVWDSWLGSRTAGGARP